MYRNQQNLYPRVPTAVAKQLQYSGLGSNTGMGFQIHRDGVYSLDFRICVKTVCENGWEFEINRNKIWKRTP